VDELEVNPYMPEDIQRESASTLFSTEKFL
jgi:hypothetical protein